MTNSLTYTKNLDGKVLADGNCAASDSLVQLHEDNVRDEKRRCPECGRMMQIRPVRRTHGITLSYAGVAILSKHRPHT